MPQTLAFGQWLLRPPLHHAKALTDAEKESANIFLPAHFQCCDGSEKRKQNLGYLTTVVSSQAVATDKEMEVTFYRSLLLPVPPLKMFPFTFKRSETVTSCNTPLSLFPTAQVGQGGNIVKT